MDLGLREKRVVITGSTRGIGLAVAKLFLQEGARVMINGVNEERFKNTLDSLSQEFGESVDGVIANISNKEGIAYLFSKVQQVMNGLDILVNNAAIAWYNSPVMEESEDKWDEMMNMNLRSTFLCSKQAVQIMKAQKTPGVILNASSSASLIPRVGAGSYAVSKAAVNSLTKSMAAELAPWNIRVNAYLPGVTETEMSSSLIKGNKKLVEPIILQRVATPEEIAAPIVFLASDKASYITAATIEIIGGKLSVQDPASAFKDIK